jgi:hypothetical protein
VLAVVSNDGRTRDILEAFYNRLQDQFIQNLVQLSYYQFVYPSSLQCAPCLVVHGRWRVKRTLLNPSRLHTSSGHLSPTPLASLLQSDDVLQLGWKPFSVLPNGLCCIDA